MVFATFLQKDMQDKNNQYEKFVKLDSENVEIVEFFQLIYWWY